MRLFGGKSVEITSGIKDSRTITSQDGVTKTKKHNAYDLKANVGTPIRFIDDVTFIGAGDGGQKTGAGYMVLVQINKTGDYILFSHLKDLPKWREGQVIHKGREIGYTGNTGFTTGAHLDVQFFNKELTQWLRAETVMNRYRMKK